MPNLQEAVDGLKHNAKNWGKYEETAEDKKLYKRPEKQPDEKQENILLKLKKEPSIG